MGQRDLDAGYNLRPDGEGTETGVERQRCVKHKMVTTYDPMVRVLKQQLHDARQAGNAGYNLRPDGEGTET